MPIVAGGRGKKHVTRDEIDEYVAATIARIRPPFYIERRFRTNEEWDRVSAYEFRNISLSDSTEVTFEQLLDRRSVALLGEPGSGSGKHRSARLPSDCRG